MMAASVASYTLWLVVKGLIERGVLLQSCICGLPIAEEYDPGSRLSARTTVRLGAGCWKETTDDDHRLPG